MKYSVSHQGMTQGPFTIEEIVSKVRGKELELFDFIFDEKKNDWVLMMEFPQLAEKLKTAKPPRPQSPELVTATEATPAPTKSAKTDAHGINEWFVLKGENRFGPFTFNDLVKMMQQKVVFPFDFIWHSGLNNWKRIAQFEEFQPEAIRTLFGSKASKNKELFSERKFKRKPFNGELLIHDNLTLWKGEGFEISRGGVGVSMKNTMVVPGQSVLVHFKQFEDWPAFNAVCEVVSKKFVSDDSPVEYGMRFVSMNQDVQGELFKKVA